MEFGIYEDGILYDNKKKQFLYFYYDEDRSETIKRVDGTFGTFEISDISPNLNEYEFEEIVQTNHIGTVAVVTCLRAPVHLHLCRAPPRIFRLRIRHQTDGVSVYLSVCEHVPFQSGSVSVYVLY